MAFTTLITILAIPAALRMARRAAESQDAFTALDAPGAPGAFSGAWVRAQFRRTDDGAGGRLQTLRRRLKFWTRCMWHAGPMRLSVATFEARALACVTQGDPAVQARPLRSYLRHGLTAGRRAQALHEHFNWLANNMPPRLIEAIHLQAPVTLLACRPGFPGVSLSRAGGLGREGELALHLDWDHQTVLSLAFSVVEPATVAGDGTTAGKAGELRGTRAVVGALQGRRGADAALRALSAACQRIRPSALLLTALQALSRAWGLQAPLCVATHSHVYAGYRSGRRKAQLDYDAIWAENHAVAMGAHYWLLPAMPVLRPDSDVESRKRAQHRRRNTLRQEFFNAAVAGTQALAAGR